MLTPSQDFPFACLKAFRVYTLVAVLTVAISYAVNVEAFEVTSTPFITDQTLHDGDSDPTTTSQDLENRSTLKVTDDSKFYETDKLDLNKLEELENNETYFDINQTQLEDKITEVNLSLFQNLSDKLYFDLKGCISDVVPHNQSCQYLSIADCINGGNYKQDDALQSTNDIMGNVSSQNLKLPSTLNKSISSTLPFRDSRVPLSLPEVQSLSVLKLNCSTFVSSGEDLKNESNVDGSCNIDLPVNLSSEKGRIFRGKTTMFSDQFVRNTEQPVIHIYHKTAELKQNAKEKVEKSGVKGKHTLRYIIGSSLFVFVFVFVILGLCLLVSHPIPFNVIQLDGTMLTSRRFSPSWMPCLPEDIITAAYPIIEPRDSFSATVDE